MLFSPFKAKLTPLSFRNTVGTFFGRKESIVLAWSADDCCELTELNDADVTELTLLDPNFGREGRTKLGMSR
jgi:hypothetical protein